MPVKVADVIQQIEDDCADLEAKQAAGAGKMQAINWSGLLALLTQYGPQLITLLISLFPKASSAEIAAKAREILEASQAKA